MSRIRRNHGAGYTRCGSSSIRGASCANALIRSAPATRGTTEDPTSSRRYEGFLRSRRNGETRKEDADDYGLTARSGVSQEGSICGSESRYVYPWLRESGLMTIPFSAKPTTLLGRVREKTIQERKFRAPPSLPTPRAATMESLIFPTSGPYATLGAFHHSATSKITGSKTTKVSALPAPPFVFPNHGLRAQIREAAGPSGGASISASPVNGTVAERPRLLKRRLDDDSDSDEVTFVGASSSKGKSSRTVYPTPPSAQTTTTTGPPSFPINRDRKGKRPVDMDFFSVPIASAATSRHNGRKTSTSSSSAIQPANAFWTESPVKVSPPSNRSERVSRPASVKCGTTATTTIPVPHTLEGSRNKKDPTLFVPKKRKVH